MDFEHYMDYYNKNNHFMAKNNIRIVALQKGYSEVALEIDEGSLNINGTLHGGVIFTMADVAAGSAARTNGVACTTLSSHINFIKTAKCGKVKAIATQIHKGRTTGVYKVDIFDEQRALLATSTFAFFFTGERIHI